MRAKQSFKQPNRSAVIMKIMVMIMKSEDIKPKKNICIYTTTSATKGL